VKLLKKRLFKRHPSNFKRHPLTKTHKTMKISILYVINNNKINAKGLCVLICRLTYNKVRKTFSTGKFVDPKNWNAKQQLVKPKEPDSDLINTHLSLIKTKLIQAFLLLQVKEISFTAEDIYKTFKGEKIEKEHNVVEFYKRYLNKLRALVEIDIKLVTWNKFKYIKDDVKSFIKWKYKTNDIQLKALEANFLT